MNEERRPSLEILVKVGDPKRSNFRNPAPEPRKTARIARSRSSRAAENIAVISASDTTW